MFVNYIEVGIFLASMMLHDDTEMLQIKKLMKCIEIFKNGGWQVSIASSFTLILCFRAIKYALCAYNHLLTKAKQDTFKLTHHISLTTTNNARLLTSHDVLVSQRYFRFDVSA